MFDRESRPPEFSPPFLPTNATPPSTMIVLKRLPSLLFDLSLERCNLMNCLEGSSLLVRLHVQILCSSTTLNRSTCLLRFPLRFSLQFAFFYLPAFGLTLFPLGLEDSPSTPLLLFRSFAFPQLPFHLSPLVFPFGISNPHMVDSFSGRSSLPPACKSLPGRAKG